jgi:DNA-binding transcriptional LysR family regulator
MDRLHSMRAFVRVVEEGSFAAAARALDISPAVVTRLVADLENHLGARLLRRTTRRIDLTEAGHVFVTRAVSVLEELEEAESLVRTETAEPRGLLRVLAPTAFSCHFLMPLLPRFLEQFPAVRLSIVHGVPDTAASDYDISIIPGIGPLDGGFIAHSLGTVRSILCASAGYLTRAGNPQHPSELLRHRCVVFHGAHLARSWVLEGTQDGRTEEVEVDIPQPVLRVNNAEVALAAALAGLGIVSLPAYMPEAALAAGTLVRVLPSWRARQITYHAAIPSRRHMPVRTRAFLDFLRTAFNHPASGLLEPDIS